MRLRAVVAVLSTVTVALAAAASASAAHPDVPTPIVAGPVAVTQDSHPFLATDIDLERYGYVEEEYFLGGKAFRYDTTGPIGDDATRIETGGDGNGRYRFKTRIVVRRPASPAAANGKVVAEWNNVTATQDIEWNWFGDPYYLLRHGYTFVGVTAQNVGVTSLKTFNSDRYSGLTVNGDGTVPAGTGDDPDALSYDVFSAALKAIRGEGAGDDPMGGINADMIIASGESQSCGRLSSHYNKLQPIHEIADAYLLTVCGSKLRKDRPEKAIRVLTETENKTERTPDDFPDTESIRHWEVAAASHLPRMAYDNVNPILSRDFMELTVSCTKFPLSLVEWPFTVNRAIDALVKWVDTGETPPIAPRGEYVDSHTLVRDEFGIALGGIRYPAVVVPTALNDGSNTPGEGGPIFSLFCPLLGSSTPFTQGQLASLYTDFADYLKQYADAADAMLPDGFILAEDIERLKLSSHQFAEIRPTAPGLTGRPVNRGRFKLTWIGTRAPDTIFQIQRSRRGAGWQNVNGRFTDPTALLRREPEGVHSYRVRNRTILPATAISESRTVFTPFSEEFGRIKVDRSGPKTPRIKLKGRQVRVRGQRRVKYFRGPVRVRVIGRADRRLPDGSNGVGLDRRSVPKPLVVRKGRRVIRTFTRDRLGNRSRPVRAVVRVLPRKRC